MYDSGADIMGVLRARASGQTLGTFLRERIFEPFGMVNTGFSVPEGKLDRLATCYQTDAATGALAVYDEARGGTFARPAFFESAAGGLVSTVDDYHAFGRMLLNMGKYEDKRILSRLSIKLMTTDQITPQPKAVSDFFPGFWDNRGWGFGVSIITRRDNLSAVPGRYGWDGGYGTSTYMDPRENVIGILMSQRLWDEHGPAKVYSDFSTSVYQAIDDRCRSRAIADAAELRPRGVGRCVARFHHFEEVAMKARVAGELGVEAGTQEVALTDRNDGAVLQPAEHPHVITDGLHDGRTDKHRVQRLVRDLGHRDVRLE